MEPSEIQSLIIHTDGNLVVTASPGSGKTYVMSEMIKRFLRDDDVYLYQGVIAISFTNKASAHLKNKSLSDGTSPKNSFFGTIHKFCLSEIIHPFINYVWGIPAKEIEIISCSDAVDYGLVEGTDIEWIKKSIDYLYLTPFQISILKELYVKGFMLIDSVGILSLFTLKNSKACRNYLMARYKKVYIDEFQDADTYVNDLFLSLVNLGLDGVAVGDENQSIYGFANKKPDYLRSLTRNQDFSHIVLDKNFRSNASIINYSTKFLYPGATLLESTDNNVFLVRVTGNVNRISDFITHNIDTICRKWNVDKRSEIGILIRDGKTQQLISNSLSVPHRIVETTKLDDDLNIISKLFADLLRFRFDRNISFLNVIEEYVDYGNLSIRSRGELINLFDMFAAESIDQHKTILETAKTISNFLFPDKSPNHSIKLLTEILSDNTALDTYKPTDEDETVIMTLHKSKGLEFDVVFHLNLNEWELPYQKVLNGDFKNPQYPNMEQDIFLHYVGLTRARKACFMIRSSIRTNGKSGADSVFLSMPHLKALRQDIRYELNEKEILQTKYGM